MERARQQQHPTESIFERARKKSPASSQVIGFLALLVTGGVSLFLGGLTLTGIVITLVLLTPVFLFFSPILVPAGIVLALCVAGVLTAAGVGVATLSALSWLYRYFKGRHPAGAEHADRARQRAMETVEQTKQKAKDVAGQAQSRAHAATPGA
ncbi:hypothetical protein KP509_31G007500 [Ceratopteris richardii]|uniref:Oleosin n=1 Tax=Ceratopteris richardii TaxID=49495 RepID=A0A8T2QVL2_CERRI|nr:hypothetical protein KP509_31G007500 [Ceratopteris richardii]